MMVALLGAVYVFIELLDCIVLLLVKLVRDMTKLVKAVKKLIKAIHDLWKKKISKQKSRLMTFGEV